MFIYWQDRTETCRRAGQDNLVRFQTDILETVIQHLFSGGGDKLIFYYLHFASYVRSRVRTSELTGTIFPIYLSVLATLIGWRPGQLPGWLTP
jgi:hypothetical protein